MLWFRWLMGCWSVCLVSGLGLAADGVEQRTVDFKTQIRPILSNRCFACHGPDEDAVESGLRLDLPERVGEPADSGQVAIAPSDLEASELVRRIRSSDEDLRMPPPHFGEALTTNEIDLLQAWIAQGAVYSKHWSFEPPHLPAVASEPIALLNRFPDWNHSPIDRLILQKLEQKGWEPSARAAPETLLRRICLDLTGLPPTMAQQRAFLDDPSAEAYERLVDELLASPAYGEHWGRRWLDLARYADSAGYADDPSREIWAYRDWVIRAYNSNMPFDQFTIEQLAGDLLDHPTLDQRIATAFHRNTSTNSEGGTNDEEFRNVAVVDRVNTTMSVWMGLTMACAQCHTHKYDPITQKEYFEVFAIFNQTEDADRRDESPTDAWFSPEQRARRLHLEQTISSLEQQLVAQDPILTVEQTAWEERYRDPLEWIPMRPSEVQTTSGATGVVGEDGHVSIDPIPDTDTVDTDTVIVDLPLRDGLNPASLTAIRLRTHPDPALPGGGVSLGDGNFVLTDFSANVVDPSTGTLHGRFVRVELPGQDRILSLAEVQLFSDGSNIAPSGKATQSTEILGGAASRAIDGNTSGVWTENSVTHTQTSESPWWELDLGDLRAIDRLVVWNRTDIGVTDRLSGAMIRIFDADRKEVWQGTVAKAEAENALPLLDQRAWVARSVQADFAQHGFSVQQVIDENAKTGWAVGGAIDREHTLDIAGGLEIRPATEAEWGPDTLLRLRFGFNSEHPRLILSRFSIELSIDSEAESRIALPADVVLALSQPDRDARAEELLRMYYARTISPTREPVRRELAEARSELKSIQSITSVPVMRELPTDKHRETRIQLRGNYRVLGDVVGPEIPEAFRSSTVRDSVEPMTRLSLARWLVSPNNPLTARVIANRVWESLFGVGIVRTSEDFGSQGDLPTHMELLDYLAIDLMRSGWDMKRFLRSVVLSESYRQSSGVDPRRFEEDPENAYLARGPRIRVAAEQVRDMALDAAGLLSHRFYGPPTRPPQPSMGLSAAFGSRTDWDTSQGEDRYRRALYTQWRRSNPYPSMATFDAPNRDVCVLKRDRTNTPLQALVTLNDPVYIEAAQGLARRLVLREMPDADDAKRMDALFHMVLSRSASPHELETLQRLLADAKQALATQSEQAVQLATQPIGPLPEGVDPIAMAAWTTVCNVVLNLDEFLMIP